MLAKEWPEHEKVSQCHLVDKKKFLKCEFSTSGCLFEAPNTEVADWHARQCEFKRDAMELKLVKESEEMRIRKREDTMIRPDEQVCAACKQVRLKSDFSSKSNKCKMCLDGRSGSVITRRMVRASKEENKFEISDDGSVVSIEPDYDARPFPKGGISISDLMRMPPPPSKRVAVYPKFFGGAQVPPSRRIIMVCCGSSHDYFFLGLARDGTLYTWGKDLFSKKPSVLSNPKELVFFRKRGRIYGLYAGNGTAYVLTDEGGNNGCRVYGIGGNWAGQLGAKGCTPGVEVFETPVEVIEMRGKEVVEMHVGDSSAIFSCKDGNHYCLGSRRDEGRSFVAPPAKKLTVLFEIEQREEEDDDEFSYGFPIPQRPARQEPAKQQPRPSPKTNSPSCGSCGASGNPLLVCGRCKKARYCSKQCQGKDWPKHKKVCFEPAVVQVPEQDKDQEEDYYDDEPTVVTGWHYHDDPDTLGRGGSDRYVYIGKNDDGEPEFIDYGGD